MIAPVAFNKAGSMHSRVLRKTGARVLPRNFLVAFTADDAPPLPRADIVNSGHFVFCCDIAMSFRLKRKSLEKIFNSYESFFLSILNSGF